MTQTSASRRVWRLLVPLLLLLATGGRGAVAAPLAAPCGEAAPDSTWHDGADHRQHHPHADALFSSGRGVARICGSRPVRLLPVQGGKPTKSPGRLQRLQTVRSPFNLWVSARLRQCAVRLQPFASRRYYVIALRHIIR